MFLAIIGGITLGYVGIKIVLRIIRNNKRMKDKAELKYKLDNLQLPGKDFDKFYTNLSSDDEKIKMINEVQENIELYRAKSFAEEVMSLAGTNKNPVKQLIHYIQELQKQQTPLGVVGIIFRNKNINEKTELSTYIAQQLKLNFTVDCIVKDPRIKVYQLSIFTQRLYEGMLVIANNGLPLTSKIRKDLAKKLHMNIVNSSINLFSEEATYNKEILEGKYPIMTKEEVLATMNQEDFFRFGGSEFMKDDLIKLYETSKDHSFISDNEKNINEQIERIERMTNKGL